MVPRINITSLNGVTTYYTYDPWTDLGTTTKAVSCSVNLSQNHQGVFTLQIEDQTGAISSNVNLGARVIIECGKQSTQMTRLISGLVRQKGYSRGGDRKRILTLSGSSTGIRLNEKILYYVNEAAKGFTGATDINDVTRKADLLLQTGLAGLTTEGVINAGGIVASSDVENFIASIAIEYGEAQDLCNLIEEQSNGEVFVDVNDLVQLRHTMQPPVAGKGFAIKNKYATNDNADDTCYLRGKSWDYTESCMKSDGYSNRVYGILPAEQEPSTLEELGFLPLVSASVNSVTSSPGKELATKFRPTHSHFLPGDIFVNLLLVATVDPWDIKLRVCKDSGGFPQDAGGVVANINISASQLSLQSSNNNTQGYLIMNTHTFTSTSGTPISSFDLDTTLDYWLIISNYNIPGTAAIWSQVKQAGSPTLYQIGASHTAGFSTDANGGSGWISANPPYIAIPRKRAQPMEATDPKGMAAIGNTAPIESTLSTPGKTFLLRKILVPLTA